MRVGLLLLALARPGAQPGSGEDYAFVLLALIILNMFDVYMPQGDATDIGGVIALAAALPPAIRSWSSPLLLPRVLCPN